MHVTTHASISVNASSEERVTLGGLVPRATKHSGMHDIHGERSAGWSGLAFVVVLIASIFTGGMGPQDPTQQLAGTLEYVQAHRTGLLISTWLGFPGFAFFLWFVVGMRAFLLQTRDPDEGLPAYALVSGTLAALLALLGSAALGLLLLYRLAPEATAILLVASQALQGPFIYMALSPFMLACGHSMRRHGTGPAWFAYLGYLGGVLTAIATLTILMAAGRPYSMDNGFSLLAFVVFVVWTIAASVQLIRNRVQTAVAP